MTGPKTIFGLPRNWAFITLANLMLGGLLGLLLRYKINFPLRAVNQNNILYAHYHFVLHAWAGLALMSCYIQFLLPKKKRLKRVYGWIFWTMIATSVGMLFSFAFQGYSFWSIFFLTVAQLVFYWFTAQFFIDAHKAIKNKIVRWFTFASLACLVISTLGPYLLAYFSTTGSATPLITRGTQYVYLHFQYNGWITLSVLGLFFNWLDNKGLGYRLSSAKWGTILLIAGVIPGFAISVIGYTREWWIYANAYFAVITQIVGVAFICVSLWRTRKELNWRLTRTQKFLWGLSGLALIAKTIMPAFSLDPELALAAFSIRPLIIGYLHLIFLIMLSLFLFAYFFENNQLKYDKAPVIAFSLWGFVISSIISEILLFLRAYSFYFSIRMSFIPKSVFYATLLMALFLVVFVISQIRYLSRLNPGYSAD